jgi:ankyrin repeat protein
MATSSVRFLLSSGKLDEADAIQSIGVAFSNEGMARDIMLSLQQIDCNDEDRRQAQREMCTAIVNAVYPSSTKGAQLAEKRQMFLDRLLLRACSDKKWGDLNAVEIFLKLGADPNTESVASFVQSNFRPLHFVAANREGTNGVSMAKALVGAGANNDICDAGGESPLRMALKHGNSLVVEYLWQINQQESDAIPASIAYEFGVVAIACQSLPMFRQAVTSLKTSINSLGVAGTEAALGRLLLACLDERSGFKEETESDGSCPLVNAVSIILEDKNSSDNTLDAKGSELLPTLECDEISKYTVLHSILRNDRGKETGLAILRPLCDLARKRESREGNRDVRSLAKSINLPCDAKYGSYTPLHLACALGCEESIQTLLEFGAVATAQDYQGNQPFQLVPKGAQLCSATSLHLGRNNDV